MAADEALEDQEDLEDEEDAALEARSPHHTEAQIAVSRIQDSSHYRPLTFIQAKKAKAAKGARDLAADEALEDQEDLEDEEDAALEARSPHHTEAQIAVSYIHTLR